MDTTVMTIRIDTRLKRSAQQVAKDLGFTVSALIHGYLTQLVKTKTVLFSASKREEPSDYLIGLIKQTQENRKAGLASPAFDNAKDAIAWLSNPKRKYARDLRQKI